MPTVATPGDKEAASRSKLEPESFNFRSQTCMQWLSDSVLGVGTGADSISSELDEGFNKIQRNFFHLKQLSRGVWETVKGCLLRSKIFFLKVLSRISECGDIRGHVLRTALPAGSVSSILLIQPLSVYIQFLHYRLFPHLKRSQKGFVGVKAFYFKVTRAVSARAG